MNLPTLFCLMWIEVRVYISITSQYYSFFLSASDKVQWSAFKRDYFLSLESYTCMMYRISRSIGGGARKTMMTFVLYVDLSTTNVYYTVS